MNNSNNPSNPQRGGAGNSPLPADMTRIVVAGFIGGLMTPLLQPLKEFLASHQTPSYFVPSFWLLGAGLGVLGAVMVWLLKETDVIKALILGVSLPAFFANVGGVVQNPGEQPHAGATQERAARGLPVGMFTLLSTTYAQEPTSPAGAGPKRSVEVNIDGQPFAYTMEILDGGGKTVTDKIDVSKSESLLFAKPLPENAASLRFTAGDQSVVKSFAASDGHTVEVTLRATSFTKKFTAAQVLGKIPDLVPGELFVTIRLREKAPIGKQGWIYVGTLHSGSWDAEHTIKGTSPPKAGEAGEIVYAANLRDAVGSAKPPLAVVSVFQRVRFLEVTTTGGAIWAHVEVIG